jgi:hypothetical protein
MFHYELQAERGVNCSKLCLVCGVFLDQMPALAIHMDEWSVLKKCNILKKSIYLLLFPTPLVLFI